MIKSVFKSVACPAALSAVQKHTISPNWPAVKSTPLLALTVRYLPPIRSVSETQLKPSHAEPKTTTRLSFTTWLDRDYKISPLHHLWVHLSLQEKWWNVYLTTTSRFTSSTVRDKNLLVLKHALTTTHTLDKMERKMISHSPSSTSVTRLTSTETDASSMLSKSNFTLRMFQAHHCWNQKCTQEFNSEPWTQRWLSSQEIKSKLDL